MSNNPIEGIREESNFDKTKRFEVINGMEAGDKPNLNIIGKVKKNRLKTPRRIIPDLSGRHSDSRVGGDLGGVGTLIVTAFSVVGAVVFLVVLL